MHGPLSWYAAWATERWSDLPWQVFDPTVSQRMPTFAESELVFASVVVVALLHAGTRSPGSVRRRYLLLWCCSLVGGAANDVVFSWLPVVDNFWREKYMSHLSPCNDTAAATDTSGQLPVHVGRRPGNNHANSAFPTVPLWRLHCVLVFTDSCSLAVGAISCL